MMRDCLMQDPRKRPTYAECIKKFEHEIKAEIMEKAKGAGGEEEVKELEKELAEHQAKLATKDDKDRMMAQQNLRKNMLECKKKELEKL